VLCAGAKNVFLLSPKTILKTSVKTNQNRQETGDLRQERRNKKLHFNLYICIIEMKCSLRFFGGAWHREDEGEGMVCGSSLMQPADILSCCYFSFALKLFRLW
jgi:hypothetical protein